MNANVKGNVPAIRSAYTALVRAWEDAGQNPLYASQLSSFLEKEGLKVGEDHVVLPISPLSDGMLLLFALGRERLLTIDM